MTYRTTCPQCASVFRLGADQLNAAQGWAQCGVCGAAFDARLSLLAEDGSSLPTQPDTPEMAEPVAIQVSAPIAELPTNASTASPPRPATADALVTSDDHTDGPASVSTGMAPLEASPDLHSIIFINTEISESADTGYVPLIYPAPTYPPKVQAAVSPPRPVAAVTPPVTAPTTPTPPKKRIEPAAPKPGMKRVSLAPRRIEPWVWGVASALLLVMLLGQTTYFLRDLIVSRLPQSRPAFEQACAVLGCSLSPPRNLALLLIIGSDLQTEANGHLILNLTLGNRATHAQAWPILVLTLTDQRSRPLARRSFAPSEYLEDPLRIATGIPPRSEQALSLPLTVHDLAPMGFDLQLTY